MGRANSFKSAREFAVHKSSTGFILYKTCKTSPSSVSVTANIKSTAASLSKKNKSNHKKPKTPKH